MTLKSAGYILNKRSESMFKRFKNIKLKWIIVHLIITLAYPAAKAVRAQGDKLRLFTDAMTIIGALLIVIGIFYSFSLHGDFDRISYVFQRGISKNVVKPYEDMQKENEEKRENSFNYPLFLGILYIIASAIIVYAIL